VKHQEHSLSNESLVVSTMGHPVTPAPRFTL